MKSFGIAVLTVVATFFIAIPVSLATEKCFDTMGFKDRQKVVQDFYLIAKQLYKYEKWASENRQLTDE